MASPGGNKALLSPPAEPSSRRSRPVADLWQGRKEQRPPSLSHSRGRQRPPTKLRYDLRQAVIRRGTAMRPLPRRTPVFSRATGEDRQPSCPAQRQRPFPATLTGSSGGRHFSWRILPMCRLTRPNTPAHCQKERLPKAGSLTGEDCGVACRRLKATWQGLLPFRGRTGNGAVTRHAAGSDVLR